MLTLKGVGEKVLGKLEKLNIKSLKDLVDFLPSNYLDFNKISEYEDLIEGEYSLVLGKITKVSKVIFLGGRKFFTAQIQLKNAENAAKPFNIKLIWFNALYLRPLLVEGEEYLVWGKLTSDKRGALLLANPKFEVSKNAKRLTGVMPIYKTKNILPQTTISSLIKQAFGLLPRENFASIMPDDMTVKFDDMLLEAKQNKDIKTILYDAYEAVHFPDSIAEAEEAAYRISLEQAVRRIVAFRLSKNLEENKRIRQYKAIDFDEYTPLFGFELTYSQKSAVQSIKSALLDKSLFNGMITGDVGSGKTAVAFLAMLMAVKSGFQCAMMSPTEILAYQHYQKAKLFFDPLGISCGFVSASCTAKEKRALGVAVARKDIDILIGTHAILNDNYQFNNLSLIVIDEQQKFGVRQRGILENKSMRCDKLSLSATPIPRSVQLSYYGGITQLVLDQRVEGRGTTSTYVLGDDKLDGLFDFIEKRVTFDERAFIVCPMIEDSEGEKIAGAETLFARIENRFFEKAALLHGRMSAATKDSIMQRFKSGELKVLVSTTVVETGVDVENATVMAIMNAERFGLATLHQLRGRVGRGQKNAYCFLHVSNKKYAQRVGILKDCKDGMEIADLDLKNRGCGELFGFEQSGAKGLYVDSNLLKHAVNIADTLFSKGLVNVAIVEELQNKMNFITMS